jgi:hypothetical protein
VQVCGSGCLDHFIEEDTYLHCWEMLFQILTDDTLEFWEKRQRGRTWRLDLNFVNQSSRTFEPSTKMCGVMRARGKSERGFHIFVVRVMGDYMAGNNLITFIEMRAGMYMRVVLIMMTMLPTPKHNTNPRMQTR